MFALFRGSHLYLKIYHVENIIFSLLMKQFMLLSHPSSQNEKAAL